MKTLCTFALSTLFLSGIAQAQTNPVKCKDRSVAIVCGNSSNSLTIRLEYGSEKCEWIVEATEKFNQSQVHTKSGATICVEPRPEGSITLMQKVAELPAHPDPQSEIHLVSPASEISFAIGNKRAGKDVAKKMGNLVKSPVVIAVWEPVLKRLIEESGKTREQLGWADLMKVAAKDHSFRFGHTHPDLSSSGVIAVISQYYAGAKSLGIKTRGGFTLTKKFVEDPAVQEFVRKVQNELVHYGESTGFYADKMLELGPENLPAAVLYESSVIEKNKEIRSRGLNLPKIVALYPEEGTFQTDHPMGLVTREWMTDEKKEAAIAYYNFLNAEPQQALAVKDGFANGNEQVRVDAQVVAQVWNDQNGVINFLNEAQKPMDQREVQYLPAPPIDVIELAIDTWREKLKKKSHVALVVDTSGSMNDSNRLDGAKLGATELIDYLQKDDRFTLIPFSSDTWVMNQFQLQQMATSGYQNRKVPYDNSRYVTTAADAKACALTNDCDCQVVKKGGFLGMGGTRETVCTKQVYIEDKGMRNDQVYVRDQNVGEQIYQLAPSILMTEANKSKAKTVVSRLETTGGTAMYDALYAAWTYLCEEAKADKSGTKTIRAIFVLTDGDSQDDNVVHGIRDLTQKIGFNSDTRTEFDFRQYPECRIPIFGVGYDAPSGARKDLDALSRATGGTVKQGNSVNNIKEIFKKDMAPFL